MSTLQQPALEELTNAPYADARQRFGGADLFVRVLAPPYPCAGIGTMRVVRTRQLDDGVELVLTYADFVRLTRLENRAPKR